RQRPARGPTVQARERPRQTAPEPRVPSRKALDPPRGGGYRTETRCAALGGRSMADGSAIDELIRRATDPAGSSESLRESVGPAFATLSPNDRPGAEAVLLRLAEEVIDAPTRPDVAGTIALCCGALVERGLGPTIVLGAILDRLECQIAPDAIAFVA